MADAVNPQVIDELTTVKANAIGGYGAHVANAMMTSMQASQARRDNSADANQTVLQGLQTAAYGEAIGPRAGPGPEEAAGTLPMAALADQLAASFAQALSKVVGNIPPVTPTPTG